MTNITTKLAGTAVIALTAQDRDFMANTYPHKAGDKWSNDQGGPCPTYKNFMDACAAFAVRLGSKQALALAMSFRDIGSTAAQRTYAGDGKTQNNIGGLQDPLRQQFKTAKLVAGKTYLLTMDNGAQVSVVSHKAGHVQATITKAPTQAATPKVAAKVADKAKATAPATK